MFQHADTHKVYPRTSNIDPSARFWWRNTIYRSMYGMATL
jgi:hypothetical protein